MKREKRNPMTKFFIILIVLLMVCFSMSQKLFAKEKDEILIGTHLPLSGGLAANGLDQKWAYEVAVEDVNKKGGIYLKEYGKKLPVRLIVLDDETDPGKAAQSVERLVKQKNVDLMLGGHSAPFGVIPGSVAAEKYKKYYHATACLIPPWLEHNFQWSTVYFFDLMQGTAVPFQLMEKMSENERPKKTALLMEDTFDGRAFAGLFRENAKMRGYSFAMDEALSVGSKDYSSQIIKAKNLGVDSILIFTGTPDVVTFIRQMKETNFSVKYFHGWKGTWSPEFYDALGKDAEYILCDGFWSMEYPSPGAHDLGVRYQEKFGKDSVSVGAFYATAQTLLDAIEIAGTVDSAKVRKAVLDNEFETVMGKVDYNEKGVAEFISAAFQWIDGKLLTVYPFEKTKYKVKIAPPWNER